jgi:hypothetical protein
MKKKSKVKKVLKTETLEILLDKEMRAAVRTAAGWERKTDAQYCRDVLREDLTRKRALARPEDR